MIWPIMFRQLSNMVLLTMTGYCLYKVEPHLAVAFAAWMNVSWVTREEIERAKEARKNESPGHRRKANTNT